MRRREVEARRSGEATMTGVRLGKLVGEHNFVHAEWVVTPRKANFAKEQSIVCEYGFGRETC